MQSIHHHRMACIMAKPSSTSDVTWGVIVAWALVGISIVSLIVAEVYIRNVLKPRVETHESSLWAWGADGAALPMALGWLAAVALPFGLMWTLVCYAHAKRREATSCALASAFALLACAWRIGQTMYFSD